MEASNREYTCIVIEYTPFMFLYHILKQDLNVQLFEWLGEAIYTKYICN